MALCTLKSITKEHATEHARNRVLGHCLGLDKRQSLHWLPKSQAAMEKQEWETKTVQKWNVHWSYFVGTGIIPFLFNSTCKIARQKRIWRKGGHQAPSMQSGTWDKKTELSLNTKQALSIFWWHSYKLQGLVRGLSDPLTFLLLYKCFFFWWACVCYLRFWKAAKLSSLLQQNHAAGECGSMNCSSLSIVQLLIEDVFSQRVSADSGQNCRDVCQLLDGLHLFRQVITLQKVGQLKKRQRQRTKFSVRQAWSRTENRYVSDSNVNDSTRKCCSLHCIAPANLQPLLCCSVLLWNLHAGRSFVVRANAGPRACRWWIAPFTVPPEQRSVRCPIPLKTASANTMTVCVATHRLAWRTFFMDSPKIHTHWHHLWSVWEGLLSPKCWLNVFTPRWHKHPMHQLHKLASFSCCCRQRDKQHQLGN